MTRIIAGRASSVRLSVPKSGTRPTSERVREAIFSTLESWDAITGARALDLYAGSGALGLEAASRGAASVVLVERNARAAALCRTNAAAVSRAVAGRSVVEVAVQSVGGYLRAATAPVDLVFVDPPYELSEAELATDLTAIGGLLSPDGVLVVERSSRSPEPSWPDGVSPVRHRDYGETRVWYAEAAEDHENAPDRETAEAAETTETAETTQPRPPSQPE